jgi:hypothetical protein
VTNNNGAILLIVTLAMCVVGVVIGTESDADSKTLLELQIQESTLRIELLKQQEECSQ